jgi:hypothetical protein
MRFSEIKVDNNQVIEEGSIGDEVGGLSGVKYFTENGRQYEQFFDHGEHFKTIEIGKTTMQDQLEIKERLGEALYQEILKVRSESVIVSYSNRFDDAVALFTGENYPKNNMDYYGGDYCV